MCVLLGKIDVKLVPRLQLSKNIKKDKRPSEQGWKMLFMLLLSLDDIVVALCYNYKQLYHSYTIF